MKEVKISALALALIDAIAFIELSDEDLMDLRASVKALEEIGVELENCTEQEKNELREALKLRISEEEKGSARKEMLEFYRNFMGSFYLDGEPTSE